MLSLRQAFKHDVKQCGDYWHFVRAVGKWLRTNGVDPQQTSQIIQGVQKLHRQPTSACFHTALKTFLAEWEASAPLFVTYFKKEWLNGGKVLLWAMYTRTGDTDTGDEKGEGYNRYLKAVPFNGIREAPVSKVLAILDTEFKNVAAMLSTPQLIEARYRDFEHAQRRHDPHRLAFLDGDESATDLVTATGSTIAMPASPPPLPTATLPQCVMDDFESLLNEISLPPFSLQHPSEPNAPPAASSAVPDIPISPIAARALLTPLSPAQLALQGKGKAACPYCMEEKKNNVCAAKACLACCARMLEHCSVSSHAKAKAEALCSDSISKVRALLELPEDQRNVYIAYTAAHSTADNLRACRQIQILSWKAEPWSILAKCYVNPTEPKVKNFLLVRIKRFESHPWSV